ncbi:hypothetical protein B0H11DRAFT_2201646 [Mycena galericulata]|nr:hypothetical protein B0H11DRAFT_2201646 [Mycena galericulata]
MALPNSSSDIAIPGLPTTSPFFGPEAVDPQSLDSISCCVLVKRPNHEDIIQVIPRIVIEQSLKISRHDAFSIRIASLILSLRRGIQFQGFIIENSLTSDLITGAFQSPHLVGVSTSRIPAFSGDGYRSGNSGYQFLGMLSQINSDIEENLTPHSLAYTSGEVISTLLTPQSSDFFSIYRPMDILPESNFILIFTLHEDVTVKRHQPGSAHSDIYSTLSFSSASSIDADSNSHAYEYDHTKVYSLSEIENAFPSPSPTFADTSRVVDWEHHITASPPPAHVSPPSAPVYPPVRPNPYPLRSRNRAGSLTTENTILLLLPTLTPPVGSSAFYDAIFLGGSSTLVEMIRNHGAMSNLLNLFVLDRTDSSSCRIFTGTENQTHELSMRTVLAACGWTDSTFRNKLSRYQNAKKATVMQWKGEVPEIGSEDLQIYQNWQGAVYMWSALGPVATGIPPSNHSLNQLERFAAALSQTSLEAIAATKFRKVSLREATHSS